MVASPAGEGFRQTEDQINPSKLFSASWWCQLHRPSAGQASTANQKTRCMQDVTVELDLRPVLIRRNHGPRQVSAIPIAETGRSFVTESPQKPCGLLPAGR